MKPLALRGALLVLSLAFGATASGLDLSRLAAHPVTPLDQARNQARLARYESDWSRAAKIQDSLLTQHPGDGFILEEIAYTAANRGRIPELIEALTRGQIAGIPGGTSLERADVEFLLGIAEIQRDRLRSGFEHLSAAAMKRPGWMWPAAERGFAGQSLLLPMEEYEADMQSALEHTDTAPSVLRDLVQKAHRGRFDRSLVAYFPMLESIPWTSEMPDLILSSERLETHAKDVFACDSIWLSVRQRHGSASARFEYHLALVSPHILPPSEALAFLSRGERTGLRHTLWQKHRLDLQHFLGLRNESDSIGAATGPSDPDLIASWLRHGSDELPAATLIRGLERLVENSLSAGDVILAIEMYKDLGMGEKARSVRDLAARENPAVLIDRRISNTFDSDPLLTMTILDSLRAAGADLTRFEMEQTRLDERFGDSLAVENALASATPFWSAAVLPLLAETACSQGRTARAERLARRALELSPNSAMWAQEILHRTRTLHDVRLARELLARLESLCRGYPIAASEAIPVFLRLPDREAAIGRIKQEAAKPDLPAWAAAQLAYWADGCGEPALADQLLARARASRPDARDVRFVDSAILTARGQGNTAAEILRGLVQEMPGRIDYQTALLRVAQGSAPLESRSSSDLPSRMAIFEHNLESTDWILESKKKAEAIHGSDAIYLMQRYSYRLDSVSAYVHRLRQTVLLLTQQGINEQQPVRLGFRTGAGTPEVRVARVIHPDGRITNVQERDILVTSAGDNESDVTNLRDLVVPFPDLEVGAVMDLVVDFPQQEAYGSGFSLSHAFGNELPTVSEILEIYVADGIEVSFRSTPSVPESKRIPRPGAAVHVWEIQDQAPVKIEELADLASLRPSWVMCTTYRSWADAGRWLRDSFWQRITPNDEIRRRAADATRGLKTPEAKVAAMLEEVVKNVHYVAIEIDRGALVPNAAGDVLTRGYGDCKDMSALLISMLASIGIDAAPVLVAPRPHALIDPDLPSTYAFTHVITYLPTIQGGIYCDPTTSKPCLAPIPSNLSEETGLLLPASGDARLMTLPVSRSEDHGYRTEMDLWPSSNDHAQIRVRSCYRGHQGEIIRELMTGADTTRSDSFVRRFLGYGLWDSCRRVSWKVLADSCDSFTLEAAYEDTSWTGSNRNTVSFNYVTEVADPFLAYPDPDDRKIDVVLPSPYDDVSVIRLHDGAGWRVNRKIASISVRGLFYEGSISTAEGHEGHDTFLEVKQRYRIEGGRIAIASYRPFHEDWLRYRIGLFQPYRYDRLMQDDEVRRLEEYVAKHPQDWSFALQAAMKTLGGDLGGEGEIGERRRATTERLLSPALADSAAGSVPCLIASGIAMREGHYFAAESLLAEGLRRNPHDTWSLLYIAGVRQELGDVEGQIVALNQLLAILPNPGLEVSLVQALYQAGRDEEARSAEDRYRALHGTEDSTSVPLARYMGFLKRGSCEEAGQALAQLQTLLPADSWTTARSSYDDKCGSAADALATFEKMWRDRPLDSVNCNNLAWILALTGRDLDRAEELVNAAMILTSSPSTSRNTLGAIIARRGDWAKAREVFVTARADDDRPSTQTVNDFFIALCDWKLGRKEAALASLRTVLDARPEPEWRRRIEKAIDLAETGDDVTKSVFVDQEAGGAN